MRTGLDVMLRWGFLEPWLSVLERQYVYGIHRQQQCSFEPIQLYVNITLPAAQIMLEGLKLLAAVAHVDYDAWKNLRFTNSSTTLAKHWEQDTDNGAIVRFQLKIGKDRGTVHDLVKMCGVQQHDHPRREYLEALARIAAMNANRDAKGRGVDIPVPVVAFFTKDVDPHELLNYRDAQRRFKWERSSLPPVEPGGLRCSFVLTEVNADLKDYFGDSIGLSVATNMQQLVNDNVWFSHLTLRLGFGNEDARERKEISGRLLASVFGNARRMNESLMQFWEQDNDSSIIRQQVDRLSIETFQQCRNDMEAICSAAIQSQTVRELELTYTTDLRDSVHWWQWIAYAFFSKRARTISSLERLALTGLSRMTTTEIKAFCGILTSENPEEELIARSFAHTGLQEATLAANSPIRWDTDGVLQPDVIQFPSPIPFLWIITTTEQTEWVDALVPGYGRCQVLSRNLILEVFNDPVNRTIQGNALTALEVHFDYYTNPRDLSGLPLFFAAIGSNLKMLKIDANNEDVDIGMVLERCPNLETLWFTKNLSTATFSFSEYRAAGSPVPAFPFRLDDIFALTEELINSDGDLTRCLKRLSIFPCYPYYLDKLDALLKMLENNRRLEYFDIKLDRTESYVEKFKKFHLQPIDRSAKLETPSKVAFLSVLSTPSIPQIKKRQCQTRDKRRNWELFDANVVTKIFQFAAAPLLRKVYVVNEL
ncbi:hypothetical protein DVH05_010110 [Phytophthora capsici]|nr:hypothetical protein DVH05_010110 [Phytophthora capsici]